MKKDDYFDSMLVTISLDEFLRVTVGEIYSLAPYHKPRFIDEIVDAIIERFKIGCQTLGNDFFYYELELKDLYKFIEDLLMSIDRFKELNLSPREYSQGVSIDSPDRPKFQFITIFGRNSEDDNFVDLDACIQNIFTYFEHRIYQSWRKDSGLDVDIWELEKFRTFYMGGGRCEKD